MTTNKYLEKMAEEVPALSWKALGAGFLGNFGGNILATGGLGAMTSILPKMIEENVSLADAGTLRDFVSEHNLPVEFQGAPAYQAADAPATRDFMEKLNKDVMGRKVLPTSPSNTHLHPHQSGAIIPKGMPGGLSDRHTVYVGASSGRAIPKVNYDVLMHELGHAKDMSRRGALKMQLGRIAPGAGGAAAVLMMANEDTNKYSTAVMGASYLPTLRSEFVASKNAYQGIKASKGAKGARMAVLRTLGPAFGTYLAQAGLMTGAVGLGSHVAGRVHKGIQEGKE